MKHIFQDSNADGNTEISYDLDHLSFASASRFKISIPPDHSFLFQKSKILADSGKSHLKIQYDLLFGSLFFMIDILIDFFFIYFL